MTKPILIVGAPRSGTSVFTWSLGQHPNIALLPETVWFPIIAESAEKAFRIGTARDKFSHLSNVDYPHDEFLAEFGEAIDRIALKSFEKRIEMGVPGLRQKNDAPPAWLQNKIPRLIHHPKEPKQRWVDGTPENSFSVAALASLFPNAKFIHIVREPIGVATSLAHFDRAGTDAVVQDVDEGLRTWMRYASASDRAMKALKPDQSYYIRNEDLRSDGEAVLRKCLGFLGEDYSENCLLPLERKINSSKVTPEEREEVRKAVIKMPIYREAISLYQMIVGSSIT